MRSRGRYIHNPAVDITKFLEAEKTSAVGGVVENKTLLLQISGHSFQSRTFSVTGWAYSRGIDWQRTSVRR